MASLRLGLLLLLLATYPACILEASALVPQLVPWRKGSLQLTQGPLVGAESPHAEWEDAGWGSFTYLEPWMGIVRVGSLLEQDSEHCSSDQIVHSLPSYALAPFKDSVPCAGRSTGQWTLHRKQRTDTTVK